MEENSKHRLPPFPLPKLNTVKPLEARKSDNIHDRNSKD